MWPINLSISVAWQALTMQIFFNLKIMIPNKNKCFWVCLVGTTLPTEKVKITIIPRDFIELIIKPKKKEEETAA